MGILITAQSSLPVTNSETIPPSLREYEIPGATPLISSGPFGDFIFQKLQGGQKDISIWHANYRPVQEERFLFSSTTPILLLQFNMGHTFSYEEDGVEDKKLHQEHFNLFHAPFLNSRMTMRQGGVYRAFSIAFSFSYLARFVAYNPPLRQFLDKVAVGQPALLCGISQGTTSQMESIIRQILRSDSWAHLKPIFLDIKVQELLLEVMSKVTHYPNRIDGNIKKKEWDLLEAARVILLENMRKPLSLPELSRRAGLNVKKIKIGFKLLYEKTPFDLLLNARMDTARRLLDERDKSVGEIAEAVGYTSVQSFSKAFKKYFGYRPLVYRNKKGE